MCVVVVSVPVLANQVHNISLILTGKKSRSRKWYFDSCPLRKYKWARLKQLNRAQEQHLDFSGNTSRCAIKKSRSSNEKKYLVRTQPKDPS